MMEQDSEYVRVTFPLGDDNTYRVLVPIPPIPPVMIETAVNALAVAALRRGVEDAISEDQIETAIAGMTLEWGVTDAAAG